MKTKKSAGLVIFYMKNKSPLFLLLKYPTYWGFVKGIIEEEESESDTILRETREEANVSEMKILPKFKYIQKWFCKANGELIKREAIFRLAEITEEHSKGVKISFEHENFKFCSLKESLELMKIKSNKEMIKASANFIKKYYEQEKLF